MEYQYTRTFTNRWDINNPIRTYVINNITEELYLAIEIKNQLGLLCQVKCNNTICIITFQNTLNQTDKNSLDTIVSNHKLNI